MERQQVEAYVDAAANALGLPIAAEHRPGVVHYVEIAAAMAELVMAFPLALADEPAPVFTPSTPGGSDTADPAPTP